MGKIRQRKSARVHLKAVRGEPNHKNTGTAFPNTISISRPTEKDDHNVNEIQTNVNNVLSLPSLTLQNNPFSGIKIKKDQLIKQKLIYPQPKLETPVVKNNNIKSNRKKDKHKLRREAFLQKLEVGQAVRAEEKKAIQRAKTPVVGDMNLLRMALPDLLTPNPIKSKSKKVKLSKGTNKKLPVHKKSKTKKKKSKKYYGLSEIKDFQKFLKQNKDFKDVKSAIIEKINANIL